MRRFAVLVALLALTGCGGNHTQSHAARDSVSLYISRVNAIEFLMRKQIVAVARTTATLGRAGSRKKTTAALARAEHAYAALHGKLAALRPPLQARKLHRSMLALVVQEEQLAAELRDLSAFSPAFAAALRPLVAANTAAQKALKGAKRPAVAGAAIRTYRAEVNSATLRLRALHPPSVERALFDGQVRRLVALDASLLQLEQALKARDRIKIAKAEHAIAIASVISDTRALQIAQRDAVLAYNARVHAVQVLAKAVQRERNRLQRTLP